MISQFLILIELYIDIYIYTFLSAYSFPIDQAFHTDSKTWKVASEICGNDGLEYNETVLKNIPLQRDKEFWIAKAMYRLTSSWIEILGT